MFASLSRCQPSGHTVRSQEVTTGNFLFDQLIDTHRASLQLSSKTEIKDMDVAGCICRERFPDGLHSVRGT